MAGERRDNAGSRPFQLRPSILSGSGLGSPFSSFTNMTNDKPSKGFMLRPSALSSAACKIEETNETRKRPLDEENDATTNQESEDSKKVKVTDEQTENLESSNVKLTEDIEKPTGIGTFGFAKDQTNDDKSSEKHKTNNNTSTNYFQQGLNNKSDKLSFVFGAKTGTNFSSFKNENSTNGNSSSLTANETLDGRETEETSMKEKLLENADQYQKTHNQRQQYKEVEQFTGEEGEQHVLQVFCKLHLFDKDKKIWLEKGRGTLRLNDICQSEGIFQSRLVFRTSGTNIVMLNTMLWADMSCEKVKEKSIRITAVDSDTLEVKVYLVTAGKKDCLQTFTAIDRRIEALKRNRENASSQKNDDTPSSTDSKVRTDDEDSSNEVENSRLVTPPLSDDNKESNTS